MPTGRGDDRPLAPRSARGSGRTTREAARRGRTRLARGRRSRGQSNVVGTVLLLGLVVMGTTTILTMGSATLANSQQQATIERAEMALARFDASVSRVAFGGAERQRASVPIEGSASLRTDPAAGWINVSVHNTTTGEVEQVVLNRSLGAVIYEKDDTTIAFQAGGVWKRTGERSTMLTPP